MANTLKFGNGQWATKVGSTLAYNDEGGNFKPLPFNFTRSTGGTRVNKDGLIEVVTNNKPRIDFLNDSNGALLLEPSRTNLITYSEALSNSSPKNGTFVDNYATSPDGTQNATKLTATDTDPYLYQSTTVSAGDYTISIYVKGIGSTIGKQFVLVLEDGVSSTLQTITSEWKRFTFSGTLSGGTAIRGVEIPNPAVTGDEVLVWGFQIEQGSYATSYIPTQGSTVTRVQEGTFITNLDTKNIITNSGSWTAFFELELLGNEPPVDKIQLSDNSNVPRAYLYGASVGVVGTGWSGGAVLSLNTNNKIIYRGNSTQNISFFDNGINEATLSSASAPITFNRLNLYGANGAFKIKQIQLFKTALSDAECIALTSL
jgi:hypothetical protein